MNIYVCIRAVLHCLLFLVNLFALTVAAWIAATSKGQGHKATAGSVLVILSSIFYAIITIGIWSETCIPRSRFSKNRTEAIALPVLFLFQIIGAIVTTADANDSATCRSSQSTCVALLILSWMSAFDLLIYYLIIMIVAFYHFPLNENLWDETPLVHDWFPTLPSKPAPPPKDQDRSGEINHTFPTEIAPNKPSYLSYNTQNRLSPWIPPHLDFENPSRTFPGVDTSRQQTQQATSDRFSRIDDVSFRRAPPLEEDKEEESASRFSLSIPRWARKLRPLRRGVELPFPVAAMTSSLRTPTLRDPNSHSIDAPVSPASYEE